MKNSVIFLRISYWMGAILDVKAALIGFFPGLFPQSKNLAVVYYDIITLKEQFVNIVGGFILIILFSTAYILATRNTKNKEC